MDLIEFWEKQVAKWQEDEQCGRCWEFSATLWEDASNILQTTESCCTFVLLTSWRETIVPSFSSDTGYIINEYTDYSFTLDIVEKGDLGTNNYDEIKGHPISESRVKTVFSPLKACINISKLQLAFCEFIGLKVDEMRWEMIPTRAYLDNNYVGWNIRASFRIQNTDSMEYFKPNLP